MLMENKALHYFPTRHCLLVPHSIAQHTKRLVPAPLTADRAHEPLSLPIFTRVPSFLSPPSTTLTTGFYRLLSSTPSPVPGRTPPDDEGLESDSLFNIRRLVWTWHVTWSQGKVSTRTYRVNHCGGRLCVVYFVDKRMMDSGVMYVRVHLEDIAFWPQNTAATICEHDELTRCECIQPQRIAFPWTIAAVTTQIVTSTAISRRLASRICSLAWECHFSEAIMFYDEINVSKWQDVSECGWL